MTRKKSDAFADVDPAKQYRVDLTRTVKTGKLGTTVLSPKHDLVMSGRALAELPADAVASYKEA